MFINLDILYMCVKIKIEKDHNFEREQGWGIGETGGRKRKGKHYNCILSVFNFFLSFLN